jgi:predicted ATPase
LPCLYPSYLKSLNIEGEDEVLNEMYILMHLNEFIENINYYLFDMSTCITYVRPLRVSTERYYRYQNYAVDEIESDGKNLAMYLANLSEKDRMLFQDWTSSLFEFSIDVIKHEGHIELQIKDGVNSPRNLVDTGFGYTQLLPILTMIWNAIKAPSRRSIFYRGDGDIPKFIVIEQPELHLHPRMQAKFGAMLAKVIASEAGKNMRFIIETHSEAILNSVGIEIEQNNLDKDKANVVLFNAAAEGYENYIEEARYNERGFIDHWPTGFLSEDVY